MKKILAVLALLLAGCAAQPVSGPKGWVVFSLVQEVAYAPAYITIRPAGLEEGSHTLGILLSDALSMHNLDGAWGVAKAVALKPGTYEIYNFFLDAPGNPRVQYRSRNDFSLQFEVRENEVAYLGEFRATRTRTKSLVDWIKGPSPYFIRVDHRARDIFVAAKATPEVQGLPSRSVPLIPVKATPLITSIRVD